MFLKNTLVNDEIRLSPFGRSMDYDSLRHSGSRVRFVWLSWLEEWVEHGYLKAFKIPNISGDDGKLVNKRTGRNHGVFIDRVRLAVHQFRP